MPHRLRYPLALLVLTGCGSSTGPGGDIPAILTELPRTLSPSEIRIVGAANAFAFDLLREATKALAPDRAARLMWQKEDLRYDETDDYQAVDLLYGNGAFAMTVLLPKGGRTPAELLAGLDPESWNGIAGRFAETEVTLTFPRFRLEYGRRLNDDLDALGMGIAFGENADFSRIADVRPERLYLTRVDQKTFVEVNEEGTEAAAATAVGIGVTSAPEPVEMRVDRPFIFAIRERLSGAVLFLGVMNVIGD